MYKFQKQNNMDDDINGNNEIEELYKSIVQFQGEGIGIVDNSENFIFANPAAEEIFGVGKKGLLGKNLLNFLSNNSKKNVMTETSKRTVGIKSSYDVEIIRDDGTVKNLLVTATPRYKDGKIIGTYGVFRDITESVRIQKALAESEKRFTEVTEQAREMVWETDCSGTYTYVNKGINSIYGYSPEEVINKMSIFDFHHPQERESYKKGLLSVFEKHECVKDMLNMAVSKSGKNIWIITNGIPVFDDEEKLKGYRGLDYDFTEYISSEESLRQSESRFKEITDLLPQVVFEIDTNGKLLFGNKKAYELFGVKTDELNNNINAFSFIHPKDKDRALSDFKRRIKGEEFTGSEYLAIKKDGKEFPVLMYTSNIYQNKTITGIRGIVIDITDRKQFEEKIISRDKLLSGLVECLQNLLHAELNFNKYVGNALKALGKAAEVQRTVLFESHDNNNYLNKRMEWVSNKITLHDSIPELSNISLKKDGFGRWQDAFMKDEIITGHVKDFPEQERVILEKQNIKSLLLVPFSVFNNFGGYIGFDCLEQEKEFSNTEIGILRGAAGSLGLAFEKEKTNEQLRFQGAALESAANSIVITDSKGKILWINPAFEKLTGYSLDEIYYENLSLLKSYSHEPDYYDNMWTTINKGYVWKGEVVNKKKNGTLYTEEMTITPVKNKNNEITHFIAIKQDISEKKKSEEELIKAKEKAEEMNRVKSYFLANMSHELRTPLVGILGYSELMMTIATDENIKEMAQVVNVSGNRLLETLNLILSLSKQESENILPEYSDVDIKGIINEVVTLFKKNAEKKNIDIIVKTSDDIVNFRTDARMMRDMLNNLVNNSIKYSSKGPVIIECFKDNSDLVLRVKDNGIGIPNEKLDVIFEPFRQVSEGLGRSFEGTGLGLTLVKKFVDTLNGSISVYSELDAGTEFIIKLPVVKGKKVIQTPTVNFANDVPGCFNKGTEKILVIEDDNISWELAKSILKENFDVDNAKNSEEAIKKVKLIRYDLILLDINLGEGINGIELLSIIRNYNHYKNIPVIAVTAFAMDNDRAEFLDSGVNYYISKPYKKVELLNLINQALLN